MSKASWPDSTFLGNVEGRDLMSDQVDVVVTDGFTGNVALKTLEGSLKTLMMALFTALGERPEAAEAAQVLGDQDHCGRAFHIQGPSTSCSFSILFDPRTVCP